MAGIYGAKWTSSWGSVPTGQAALNWLAILKPMSSRQVRLGLRCCLTAAEPWPPSPGGFRQAVQDNDSVAHRPLPVSRRIGQMVARPEVIERERRRMREILGEQTEAEES